MFLEQLLSASHRINYVYYLTLSSECLLEVDVTFTLQVVNKKLTLFGPFQAIIVENQTVSKQSFLNQCQFFYLN